MFGASPARARFVASGLRPPVRVVHRIPGRGLIEMPPAVSQGRVVFGTHDGLVIAARVRDGARVWATNLGGCIASSPAVRAGIVYIGWSGAAPCGPGKDGRGGLVALGLDTGRVLWRFNAGNVEASPAIVDDMLFFSGFRTRRASRVYAMRLGDRRRIALELRAPDQGRIEPGSARPEALHLRVRQKRLQLRRLERAAEVADDGVRRGRAGARPARSPQPGPATLVVRGRLLRDSGGRLRPRLPRRDRRRVLGIRRLHRRPSLEPEARRLDLRLGSPVEGDRLRRDDWRASSTRSRRATGERAGSARLAGRSSALRPSPTVACISPRPSGRRSPSPPAQARSNGASPTATTPRSSSPARAGSSSGRGGSTRSRTRRAGRLRARLARPPPPRVPRARRAGTAPSRTRRPRRRPRASPSR